MILTHNKGAAFPMPIFTKLTKSEQHYMQFSHTELPPNRAVSAESMSRNTVISYVKWSAIFWNCRLPIFLSPVGQTV